MSIDPKDLFVTSYPPREGMMIVGTTIGVSVFHLPTGIGVVCTKERSMLTNRDKAITMLELLLEMDQPLFGGTENSS